MSAKNLIVDLDGCLISTDLLYEALTKALFKKPWIILWIPYWLIRGKARIKQELSAIANIDVATLPYNSELISYLEAEYASGRKIILCTGSWSSLAEKIFNHFSFFSDYHGSTPRNNLTGANKAKLLKKTYGERNFSYIGNETKDLKIWRYAQSAVVIYSSEELKKKVGALCFIEKAFATKRPSIKVILKAIRIHQWVKNLLIFTPLATAHQITNFPLLFNSVLAFIAFSLCASSTYIINDLSDLESDRKHPKKCDRPLASGQLSIKTGMLISVLLFILSFTVCTLLPVWFVLCLSCYIFMTVAYSFKFKRMQTVDIVILACLYTLRIFAGGAAIAIQPSFWLLAFSMFVFLCLAIVKRVSEINRSKDKYDDKTKLSGRGYYVSDLNVLISLAASSGMLSILVFSMYINSKEVVMLYQQPFALWFICPVFGYWVIRILIMASRGEVDEDPIVFTIKDWRSWFVGLFITATVLAASVL